MSGISKINGIALANVAKVNNIAIANVDKVSGITVPAAGPTFTTDKLLIWYDAALESSGSTTLTNRVDGTLTGAIVQDGHGAGRVGNASVQSVDGTQAMYLDGVNDAFYKRAYFSALDGSGEGNHGTSTFGVANNTMVSNPSTNATDTTGFSMEVWWRTNGSFLNNGNLWSYYHNAGIRTRFNSSGVRWYYMNGSGVQSSGWGTYNTNTWYHDITTLSAPDADGSSSGRHTLKLYSNGSLVQSLTNRTWNPLTWVRDFILFGGFRVSGSSIFEDFRGYYGIVRFYHKALSSSEVTANYNAEKSRYGY